MKAKVNPSLQKKMAMLGQKAEEKVKDQLIEIAQFATTRSPVDTGAYVTSFSMKPSYSSGRGITSNNKPRRQNPQAKRQEGLAQLLSDIETLKPLENPLVVLSNGSPHARQVETGEGWNQTPGYAVFAQVRDRFR